MDGYIVGSMISANSITGEQIQANSIKTANLELSVQKKIQDATNEETVKALIKADLDGFESTLSKEFVTVENATTQIQQATEVAVKEATQSIIDNAVSESMGAVDGQLNDKLNQYTGSTLLPAIAEKAEEVLQNAEDYVVTQLESYATKKELSSSISQTREQIELSVSEKYTTKTESATIITEAIDGITVGAINRVLGTGENKSFKFNGGANEIWLPYKFSNDISDKEVFVSFKYTLTGTAQNGSQIEFAPSYLKKTNNQTVYRPKHVFFTSDRLQDVNITDTVSFTTKDFQDISSSSTSYIRFVGNGFTGTLSVSEAQIKQGNSKTSWSPAPEDTITDITNAKNDAIGSANNTLIATIANYYTKSETDSQINVAKEAINLGVSQTYETKTSTTTKINNAINGIKIGGANLITKKSDFVYGYIASGNGSLNNTGSLNSNQDFYNSNYTFVKSGTPITFTSYPKDGVTSSIENAVYIHIYNTDKVWQWCTNNVTSANAIATKTYVTTGDCYVRFSSRGFNDYNHMAEFSTKPSEWSPSPKDIDTDINKKANIVDVYTKTQTDSAITVAKEAINLGVSKTYETKTNVTNKINGVNNSINSLTTRMTNAESKITDEAITNTVKQSFYTKQETENAITTKGYTTQSQLQQTVNDFQFKFSQSGGYNRIRNGIFKNGTSQWSSLGSPTISTKNDSGHSYGKSLVLVTTGTNQGVQQTVSDLCSGKTYTLSAHVYTWAANDCGIQIQCGGNYYSSKVPTAGAWQRISLTFKATSTSATVQIGRGGWGANGQHLFTAIQFEEGELATTYTPHPSEIYDGITTIDKDGINVSTSYGAHTQFHAGGMSSYNNSNQRTLGIENGGISFHAWNNNALAAYVTQSSLWSGSQSANGLAISTTANGAYLALGTSSLSDVNTTLNMDQALTISASDSFQPKGINFWKDVHAHGYGIRQLSHLKLAGSGAIQFDYLNNSPSTIYEAVDSGHSLYVMGGYQMHLGCMAGTGTPKGMIWFKGQTDTHSYTHWDFHNYTMYNMKTASTYANYQTRRIGESYGVTSNVDGVRYVYRNVELVNGKAIRSIPLEYKGCEYDIVSIVCKGRGNAWVQDEDVDKFVIEGDCQSVNIEIIIHEIEQNLHTVALDEAYMEPLPQKTEPEIPSVIKNVSPDTL